MFFCTEEIEDPKGCIHLKLHKATVLRKIERA